MQRGFFVNNFRIDKRNADYWRIVTYISIDFGWLENPAYGGAGFFFLG